MIDQRFEQVRGIIADTMRIPADLVLRDSSSENLEGWDSLSHLNLISAIEKEFDVAFDRVEVMNCLSVESLLRAVAKKAPPQHPPPERHYSGRC